MEFGNSVTFSRRGGTFEIQEGSFPSWGKTNDKLSLHLNDQKCGPKTESFSIAETEETLKQLFTCHKLGICNHLVDAHEYIGSCNLERKNSHLSDTISGNMVYMTSPNLDDY